VSPCSGGVEPHRILTARKRSVVCPVNSDAALSCEATRFLDEARVLGITLEWVGVEDIDWSVSRDPSSFRDLMERVASWNRHQGLIKVNLIRGSD
jgi:hypothetical protein